MATRIQRIRSGIGGATISLLLALGIAAVAAAQQPTTPEPQKLPAYRFRLLGVYDQSTGQPIEGVEVADLLTGASRLTSSTGTVSLYFMPDGGGLVRIRKVGFEAAMLPVTISATDTTPVTIILARAVELPAVVTRDSAPQYRSAALRGFEERRAQKFGHFISEADLRKADGRRLVEALRTHVPGLVFLTGAGGASYLVSQRNCGTAPKGAPCANPRCYVHVFLDGALMDGGGVREMRTDFNRLDVSQFAGVEFYADGATAPAQYNGTGSDCGTLLLWTRER